MGKVYACSDLHGMLNMFDAICEILQPDDIVYFLGDAGDRGPQPWETIKKVAEHPQFIYLKGNHEDMLVKALKSCRGIRDEIINCQEGISFNAYLKHDYRLLLVNGGEKTLKGCMMEEQLDEWIKYLEELPSYVTYKRKDGKEILMSHAGFTPTLNDEGELWIPNEHELLWDKTHFYDPWEEDGDYDDYIIVHGHTTIPSMVVKLYGEIAPEGEKETDWYPYVYADGHKVCIDAGAFFTGYFILLDLDDFEESFIFQLSK